MFSGTQLADRRLRIVAAAKPSTCVELPYDDVGDQDVVPFSERLMGDLSQPALIPYSRGSYRKVWGCRSIGGS